MASGNPILATWGPADGVLRTFELTSGGGFVQIDSINPGAQDDANPFPPRAFFAHDGKWLLLARSPTVNSMTFMSFDPESLSQGSVDSRQATSGTNAGYGTTDYDDTDNWGVVANTATASAARNNNGVVIGENGLFSSGGTNGASTPLPDLRSVAVSPNGLIFIRAQGRANTTEVYARTGYLQAGSALYPTYRIGGSDTPLYTLDTDADIDFIGWTPDSRFMVTLSKSEGIVQVYKLEGTTLTKEYSIDLSVYGEGRVIATSPDKHTIAVGFYDGATARTVIFNRIGPYLQQRQMLSGIGRLLNFTADGKYLFDASGKTGYTRDMNGVWSVVAGMMDNIPGGVTVQAISPHVQNPKGWGSLYDSSVQDLTSDMVNMNDLKFTILTEDASFVPYHTSFAQVTNDGAYEVSGGGWPAGGLPVENVQFENIGSLGTGFTCDPISRIVIEQGIEFRYALVYDDAKPSKKPLLLIDFQGNQQVPLGTEMSFDFSEGGLIAYSL